MKIGSEKEMIKYGQKLAKLVISNFDVLNSAYVIELIGDVGVGKTTLVRGLAEGLGAKETVTSPSFTISKVYALPNGRRLIHYDFYRLENPGLMIEDLKENLTDAHNVVIIEWGESVANILPKNHLKLDISYNDDETREVTV